MRELMKTTAGMFLQQSDFEVIPWIFFRTKITSNRGGIIGNFSKLEVISSNVANVSSIVIHSFVIQKDKQVKGFIHMHLLLVSAIFCIKK
jgi:hypothetical protein